MRCHNCKDVVALRFHEKRCRCGRCRGRYLADGLVVRVAGPCVVLGAPWPSIFEIKEPNERVMRDESVG